MKISPSLMCANPLGIIESITTLRKLNVDFFHFDVMDGNFVNNLALNLEIIKEARKLTRIPFDVHLMVQKPSAYFEQLIECGADIIIFHVECLEDVTDNIDKLRLKNVKIGLALNLETPPDTIIKYLPLIDYVLVMNVKTGFLGQKFNEDVLKKINYIYNYITVENYETKIISDGGIKLEHLELLYNAGVDIIVAGTSLLFNERGFSNNFENFRNIPLDPAKRKIQEIKDYSQETRYNACILREINKLELIEKSLRPLEDNEVVVKVMSCGICGSDIVRVYEQGMYSKNLVPGHEFAGFIFKTTKSKKDMINKRVVVYPLIPCRKCKYCKSEKYNLCENYNYLGSRSDGGFSELVIVPQENLIPIPNSISYDEAALIEPLSVAYRGVKKLKNLGNSDVLILGLGQLGLLSGMVCIKLGANTVTGVDRHSYKGKIAKTVGFSEAISLETDVKDKEFNIMIDCSGSSELINCYIPHLQKESSILLLGNHKDPLCFSSEMMSKILRSEFKIFSSWNSNIAGSDNDWQVCVNYLARGELDVSPLITHKYPLNNIVEAFYKIRNKEIEYVKVIINP
jgi:L-iditol 2-dehydrogenase